MGGDRYTVVIMDGRHMSHTFFVDAYDKDMAWQKVWDSFAIYGKPYGVEKDGIIGVDIYRYEEVHP